MPLTRSFAIGFACIVLTGACSIDDGSGTETRSTTTSTTTEAVDEQPTTTVARSVGIVEVADETHEIEADCYAPGAGEVLATGSTVADDGRRIEVYLQAFLGAPYLGISVIDGDTALTYEAAVDRPLEIITTENVIRVDDVALVTDLDLSTGDGVDAGVGTVVIECRSYAFELPDGFAAG